MDLKIAAAIADAILRKDAVAATQLLNPDIACKSRVELRFLGQPVPRAALILQIVSRWHAILWLSEENLAYELYSKRVPQIGILAHAYLAQDDVEIGCVHVHLGDGAARPGLGFSAAVPQVTLIPDAVFIRESGYQAARLAITKAAIPWADRKQVAFWRGSSSGPGKSLMQLPRIALCRMGIDNPLLDVGITNIPRPRRVDTEGLQELQSLNIVRPSVPINAFGEYRYQIDIDGNTNSWPGLFQKLLTGSTVLKVASAPGYRQWYYDRLVPWKTFVPVESDMSDLVEKIKWLIAHDDEAREIGKAGQELAESISLSSELLRVAPLISAAIRSSGVAVDAGVKPHGEPETVALTAAAKDIMERVLYQNPYENFPAETIETDFQGWNSEHPVFKAAITLMRPTVIIEVGTWKGMSAIHMAEQCKALGLASAIICVDTWLGSPEHMVNPKENRWIASLKFEYGYPTIYRTFLANVVARKLNHMIVPLPATSDNAAVILKRAKVKAKIVFIDAAHQYDPVLRDLNQYWDIVETGGLMLGDDYGGGWVGVTKAVDEFVAARGLELVSGRGKFAIAKGPMPQQLRDLFARMAAVPVKSPPQPA